MATYLVTGGCGFIGSNFVRQEIEKGHKIVNLDILSYAASQDNLADIADNDLYMFIEGDICDRNLVSKLLSDHNIDAVINFAAESHVDNSITGPQAFIQTNIVGTFELLMASLHYWQSLPKINKFRFVHVSTDEVFGDLPLDTDEKFTEETRYDPSSPYSASKAASDHLVRAWYKTYGLPTIVTNCTNNYGPYQHPEKLIPRMILCALNGEKLPVYGTGENVRDWIFVQDHCRGIALALTKGVDGETYAFGGNAERRNIDLVHKICDILDEIRPKEDGTSYHDQISFVEDRLGHDRRYAIDDSKSRNELGYTSVQVFEENLKHTVKWYINFCEKI